MDDYKKVRDLWFKTTYLSVMELSQPAEDLLRGDFRKLSFKDYITVIKELWADGGIDVTPLKELLTEVISEEEIRSSKIDYGLVIFSVSNLEPEMLYIDQIPQGKGFKDIVIVDIGLPTPVDIVNYFTRNTDDSFKFTFIRPREHYGSSLNFEPEISKKYLVEGYLDTMQVYGYLQGEKYYIYGSEDMIKEMFDSLNTEKQEEALSILEVDENDNIKDLYSGLVLPVFKSALWTGYNDKTGYVSLNILEELAKMMGIEPLSVYTQKELLERINDKTESNRFNYPIIGFINRWRYERIINFLEYLVINAGDQIAQPEGYDNFINQLNALLE
jgi:NTE family protein